MAHVMHRRSGGSGSDSSSGGSCGAIIDSDGVVELEELSGGGAASTNTSTVGHGPSSPSYSDTVSGGDGMYDTVHQAQDEDDDAGGLSSSSSSHLPPPPAEGLKVYPGWAFRPLGRPAWETYQWIADCFGDGGVGSSVFVLLSATLGAGTLAFPFAFKECGWGLGFILMVRTTSFMEVPARS